MEQPPVPADGVAAGRKKRPKPAKKMNRSWLLFALLPAAVVALVGLQYLVGAYNIPSGAMLPTLQIGDHIVATRYVLLGTPQPRRGELVVFRYPDPNPNTDPVLFVKRVIALPGDQLEVDAGQPIINGLRLPRCSLGTTEVVAGEERRTYELFVEFLEGVGFLVARDPELPARRQGPYTVPPGELYVLGDNRDNSSDSRAWNGGRGAGVPFDHLERRATWVWLSNDGALRDLNGGPRLLASLSHLQPALDRCMAKAPSAAQSTPPAPAAR